MQPPIPAGTLLQGHYRLLNVLGQGGFGRTYLAEDLGRFNERCVVKEYIPVQTGTYALEKSKELFRREATILYQIEHPQIPKFRSIFEQGRRLFFVQDYVEGKTYSALLEERLAQNQTFSEQEVLHLLQQILPVLTYIHGQNIIHRDISPDNIILRSRDQLPVLIDFGVVKELANRMQTPEETSQGTSVGKLGYAPSEQLQTGKAYPNSDLYALAVTAVVLLTGQKPQDLLDESTLTWHWQQRVPALSPKLVHLLNRMLSPKPNNRFQSATEVAQALRSLEGLVPPAVPPGQKQPSQPVKGTSLPPAKTTIQSASRRSTVTSPVARPAQKTNSLGWVLGMGAIVLLGVGPWILFHSLLQSRSKITSTPNPTVSSIPTPTPVISPATPTPVTSPVASPTPMIDVELLNFPVGQNKLQVTGRASPVKVKRYIVNVTEGQSMTLGVSKGAVALSVRSPGGEIVAGANGVTSWQSQLTSTGGYQVDVTATAEADFTLEIGLQNPSLPLTPSPVPLPSPPLNSSPTASPPLVPLSPTPAVPVPSSSP